MAGRSQIRLATGLLDGRFDRKRLQFSRWSMLTSRWLNYLCFHLSGCFTPKWHHAYVQRMKRPKYDTES